MIRSRLTFVRYTLPLILAIGFSWSLVCAQAPTARLNHIYPPGGMRGSTVDVTVAGANLDEATTLVFSHPQIQAKPKTTPGNGVVADRPVPNQFSVEIPATVEPGIYEARTVGRFGLSTPRRFAVGVELEVICDDKNQSHATATPVSIGSVVNGKAPANSRHYFKFAAKKSEKVTLHCQSFRIDSRLQPVLVVSDLSGREIQRSRANGFQAATLFFQAPIESQYVIEIRDAVFSGGADYFYRLQIATRPFLSAVFPNTLSADPNQPLRLYGWNLPGGKETQWGVEELSLSANQVVSPAALADEIPLQTNGYELDWKSVAILAEGKPISNRIPIYTGQNPVVVENESAESTEVQVPSIICGRLLPGTEVDYYEFQAKAGQAFYFDAFSHRLGANSDLIVSVQQKQVAGDGKVTWKSVANVDDAGNRAATTGPDFSTTSDDPTFRYQIPADGTYRVKVKDQFGTYQSNLSASYRLEIRTPRPDFHVVCQPAMARPANGNQILARAASVRRDGKSLMTVNVIRTDGFTGEVELSCENLPQGVSCPKVVLQSSQSSADLVFHADEKAALSHSFIQIVGTSQIGEQQVRRKAFTTVVAWDTGNKTQTPGVFRQTANLELSVVPELAPFNLVAGDAKNPTAEVVTSLGGKVQIPLKLNRRNFAEAIQLTARHLPGNLKPGDITIAKDKSDGAIEVFVKDKNTIPGIYHFTLFGEGKVKYSRNPEAVTEETAELKRLADLKAANASEKAAAVKSIADAKASMPQLDKSIADAKSKLAVTNVLVEKSQREIVELSLAIQKAKSEKTGTTDPRILSAASAHLETLKKDLTQTIQATLKMDESAVQSETAKKTAAEKQIADWSAMVTKLDTQVPLIDAATKATQARLDQAKKASVPIDLIIRTVSNPITVKVVASPIEIKTTNVSVPVGGTTNLQIEVNRLYGFADVVTLTFKSPTSATGLMIKPASIAKDQTSITIPVELPKGVAAGAHTVELTATAKFNNVDTTQKTSFTINVTPLE